MIHAVGRGLRIGEDGRTEQVDHGGGEVPVGVRAFQFEVAIARLHEHVQVVHAARQADIIVLQYGLRSGRTQSIATSSRTAWP